MAQAQEIIIEVAGMTEDIGEGHVVAALAGVPGVTAARASRSEGQAVVTADPLLATPEKLQKAIADAGYEPGEVRFPE